jgi:hypothetical protein
LLLSAANSLDGSAGLTIEGFISESNQQSVDRCGCYKAQPDGDIEEGYHGNDEHQERQFIAIDLSAHAGRLDLKFRGGLVG